MLPNIFEDFFRGEESRPMTGGAGLGLGIAQRIIASHGGEITVESAPQVGSTFRITLPLEREPQPVL
jgi:two-component system OmpR family sensor kinase